MTGLLVQVVTSIPCSYSISIQARSFHSSAQNLLIGKKLKPSPSASHLKFEFPKWNSKSLLLFIRLYMICPPFIRPVLGHSITFPLPYCSPESRSTTSSLMTPACLQCRGLTSAPSPRILWLHLFICVCVCKLTPLLFLLSPQFSPFLTVLSKIVYMWAYTQIHMHAHTRPFNPYSIFPLDSLYFQYFYLGIVTTLCIMVSLAPNNIWHVLLHWCSGWGPERGLRAGLVRMRTSHCLVLQ